MFECFLDCLHCVSTGVEDTRDHPVMFPIIFHEVPSCHLCIFGKNRGQVSKDLQKDLLFLLHKKHIRRLSILRGVMTLIMTLPLARQKLFNTV